MDMRNTIIKAAKSILNDIDNPNQANKDSVIFHLGVLTVDPTFDPIDNDLISSGNIRLLRNEKLKRLLSMWSSDIIAVKENEILWQDAANKEYRPFLVKNGLSRDAHDSFLKKGNHDKWTIEKGFVSDITIGKSRNSIPINDILSNQELEGYLALAITLNAGANQQSVTLKHRIEEILMLLNQSIEK